MVVDKRVLMGKREASRSHTSDVEDFTMLVEACQGIIHHFKGFLIKVILSNKITEVKEIVNSLHHFGRHKSLDSV
jgi:hypothetical protein